MRPASKTIDLTAHPTRYVGNAASPFRYPGGKGFLSPFLSKELRYRFGDTPASFAEPYCGGAGAALNLLVDGIVERIYLNDADIRIYSAWHAIVHETDRFIAKIQATEPTIASWEHSLHLLHDVADSCYDFDVGFAAFFVNRTSRSGVLLGSGPIGGYDQTGKWKIDARYNKQTLATRIRRIGDFRTAIELYNEDGLSFCKALNAKRVLDRTLLFIDPPYVTAGGRLYYDGMSLSKHDNLSEWLQSGFAPHWLLTYDDHPLVRENYKLMQDHKLDVRYSLGKRRVESELLYMSNHGIDNTY